MFNIVMIIGYHKNLEKSIVLKKIMEQFKNNKKKSRNALFLNPYFSWSASHTKHIPREKRFSAFVF